jgi:predicted patatin/cPLA2 family phospholipase
MQFREPLGRQHLPAPSDAEPRSAIDLLLARAASGSTRGNRTDGRVLALAIEGGGQAGVVSGGMCVALEALGLIDAVDAIYGTSAGALNGLFTATGQAAKGATNYEDTTGRWFANPARMLAGKPAVNLEYLFDEIIRKRKPFYPTALADGPAFFAIVTDIASGAPVSLGDFKNVDEVMRATWISCSIPYLAGPPMLWDGRPMADGSLAESMPYRAAQRGGATDVIVLRSRPSSRRKAPYPKQVLATLRKRAYPGLADLVEARPAKYNADAEELIRLTAERGHVMQIAPPEDSVHVHQLERSQARIRAGFAAGAHAATAALGVPHADILWAPRPYVTVDV